MSQLLAPNLVSTARTIPQNMNILVVGATGLVGYHFVQKAQESIYIKQITVLVRKPTELFKNFDKVKLLIQPDSENWDKHILEYEEVFDLVFSALGTKRGDPKAKNALRDVDYDLTLKIARAAKTKGASIFALVTSFNHPLISAIFPYFNLKQQIEDAIIKLGFEKTIIFRPGPIIGDRKMLGQTNSAMTTLLSSIIGQLTYKSPFSFVVGTSLKVEEVAESAVYLIETGLKKYSLKIVSSEDMFHLSRCLSSI